MKKRALSKIAGVCVFVIFLLTNVNSFAQDFKIGYVDPRVILDRMPEAKAIQQQIQNLYERKSTDLSDKQRELQNEIELYQQKEGVISEQARQEEEERLILMDQEIRQLQTDVQQEIQQQQLELMTPLIEKIRSSVNQVASQQDLDLVLDIAPSGYSILDRTIIQTSPELQANFNITQQVIDDLGL